jgi:pyruvate-ferredoxin/flavodoxin oxidoreductase
MCTAKSGGTTISHLRFGDKAIRSPYLIDLADYITCHNKSFIFNYDILKGIKENGIFLLNCDWTAKELKRSLPQEMKQTIARKRLHFYTVDAISIAGQLGLGNRINMVMQAIFFKLVSVISLEQEVTLLKRNIDRDYGKKGTKVVKMNRAAVDAGIAALHSVQVPESWGRETCARAGACR